MHPVLRPLAATAAATELRAKRVKAMLLPPLLLYLTIKTAAAALSTTMNIKSLHRYAVKGLSGDSLQNIPFQPGDGTFQDDRRFALLFDTSGGTKFDVHDPNWLHKVSLL